MPMIGRVRMLRSWGGIMDMSMDGSPIIDQTPVDGLYLNAGWCYGGFKATPASGWCFAHLIATRRAASRRRRLSLDRFATGARDRREGRGRAAQSALRPDHADPLSLLRRARRSRSSPIAATPRVTRPDSLDAERRATLGSTTSICATTRPGCIEELWYHGARLPCLARGRRATRARMRSSRSSSPAKAGAAEVALSASRNRLAARRPDRPRRSRCASASTARR